MQSRYDRLDDSASAMYMTGTPLGPMGPPQTPIPPALNQRHRHQPPLSTSGIPHPSSPSFSHFQDSSIKLPGDLQAIDRGILVPSEKSGDNESDPLVRFWQDPGPWNSQRIRGVMEQAPSASPYAMSHDPINRPYARYGLYREQATSDVGSQVTGKPPTDSGYGGSRSHATKSVRSADHLDQSQDTQSLLGEVHGLQLQAQTVPQEYFHGDSQSIRYDHWTTTTAQDNSRDNPASMPLECDYPDCTMISRNQSEHK